MAHIKGGIVGGIVNSKANPVRDPAPARPSKAAAIRSPGWTRSLTVTALGPNIARLGRKIPLPDVPVEPVASLASIFPRGPGAVPSLASVGPMVQLTAGRAAIALALQNMGLDKGDQVLVPAFHCASMVSPLASVGAEPVFFRLNEDLSVNLEDIAAKVTPRVRVLMVSHYFGFPQDMPVIREFCDAQGLWLLEDCAHSFFGRIAGQPVGAFGDYAIGSPRKFFPIPDGGCLVSVRHEINWSGKTGAPLIKDFAALDTMIAGAVSYRHLSLLRPFYNFVHAMARVLRRRDSDAGAGPAAPERLTDDSGASDHFDNATVNIPMSRPSRFVLAVSSKRRIIARRRRNFELLLREFNAVPGCRPLIAELPGDVVPYTFPLWVDDLDRVFPDMEDAAVAMQRFGQFLWSGVDEKICAVSARYSHHLLQIACHQELTEREISSLAARVRAAIAAPVTCDG